MKKEENKSSQLQEPTWGGGTLKGKRTQGRTEKKILIVSSIGILLTILIGISYAYISYTNRQVGINVLETDCINVTMEELTNAINLKNTHPVTDEVGETLKPFRFKLTNTCGVGVDYNINLEVIETNNRIASSNIATKVDELEKSILSSNATAPITYQESDYTGVEAYTISSGSIEPYESITHEIRIWLDESAGNDSQNGTFYSKVVIDARQNQNTMAKFSDYIIEQMEEDTSIEEFEHVATHQTPALKDYRYVGSNPNNYVYFGCEENCTLDNLYRIIGVIPTQSEVDGEYVNRIKLIKSDNYIGNNYTHASYGYTPSGYGYNWFSNGANNNKWEESTISTKVLNEEYWNSLGEYQKYILTSLWYLGAPLGTNKDTYSPKDYYINERGNVQCTSKGNLNLLSNISLMYPSDFGFSLGLAYQNESITTNFDSYKNVWLYNLGSNYREWTMTADGNYHYAASFAIFATGLTFNNIGFSEYPWFNIRPTFYLKENVLYESGEGTQESPYRISIQ